MLSARQCRNEWRWDDNVGMGGRPRMIDGRRLQDVISGRRRKISHDLRLAGKTGGMANCAPVQLQP